MPDTRPITIYDALTCAPPAPERVTPLCDLLGLAPGEPAVEVAR